MSFVDYEKFRASYVRAVENGADRTGLITACWDIFGSCENPVGVEAYGRPEGLIGERNQLTIPSRLILKVRCRRCTACLRFRAYIWRARAEFETLVAARTWFGTLTLSPESQYLALLQARAFCQKRGINFDELSAAEQFQRRHEAISKEITRYLKRVRKNSGSVLRYLLVAESHKSGLPHYHMLLHEVLEDRPVRKALLHDAWRAGFSSYKLADPKTCGYVTKYLSKSMLARVRASIDYGQTLRRPRT